MRSWSWRLALAVNSLDKRARFLRKSGSMKAILRSVLTSFVFLGMSAVAPKAQAVVPPPDGGYPNFTTAEGTKALFSLTTGSANTAVGWYSLFSNAGAASTPLPAQGRCFSTTQTPIRRLARRRFYSTPPASTTPLLERPLLNNTIAEENTATGAFAMYSNTEGDFNTATVRLRSISILSGSGTPPSVIARYIKTPKATATRPSATLRS